MSVGVLNMNLFHHPQKPMGQVLLTPFYWKLSKSYCAVCRDVDGHRDSHTE